MGDFGEEFGAMLRGADKRQSNRELAESIHPPEAEPEPDPDDEEAEQFVARLLAPKRWHGSLVDTPPPPDDDGTPDFDGGARETPPEPENPEGDHDELVRNLLAPRDPGVYP